MGARGDESVRNVALGELPHGRIASGIVCSQGIGGTIVVIFALVCIYMIRSPLTGIHRDTVSRWAAAVESLGVISS